MRTILVLLVALFLATGAYALNETATNGPQNITSCYMIGTTDVTSGNVVVLTDDADTTRTMEYIGREVTFSTSLEEPIYGVVVDTTTYDPANMAKGKWVEIQTYGYCPIIKVDTTNLDGDLSGSWTVTGGDVLWCSGTAGLARVQKVSGEITSNAVALTSYAAVNEDSATVTGWLYW